MGRGGAGHKGDRNPPPAGLQGWTQSADPGGREERRLRPLRKRTLSGASGGAGRSEERAVGPAPRGPNVVTCRGRLESREAQVAALLSGEREKRKGKPEGVEVKPGGQGAARAPASRSAGCASASAAR